MVERTTLMKYYMRITDIDWYKRLKAAGLSEVNFWTPGHKMGFNALEQGEMFLFKSNARSIGAGKIIGGGYFVRFERTSFDEAWQKYGEQNGCADIQELRSKVQKYRASRGSGDDSDPRIGCIILDNVFFFDEDEWIDPPSDWGRPPHGHPLFKTYSTDTDIGKAFYDQVKLRLRSK
jgi:putative restriction endonuclease